MRDAEQRSLAHYQARARWYDWANRLAALVRGTSQMRERRSAVRRLALEVGQTVLEVAVGTGTNLALLAEGAGPSGRIAGIDLSPAMLRECQRKIDNKHISADLIEGTANALPFRDCSFDAVFHHGGIAEFGDRRPAIEEMIRVARPGAKIVICDVGVPEDRHPSLVNRLLLKLQPEYQKPPPIDLVPESAGAVQVEWFARGAWYALEFRRAE